jgi:hypothetical protein
MTFLIFLFRAHVQQLHCGRVADDLGELFRRDCLETFIAMSIHSPSCYNNNSENDCENDFRIHNILSLKPLQRYDNF